MINEEAAEHGKSERGGGDERVGEGKVLALCCFHIEKGKSCSLPSGDGTHKTCRWRHADDDGSACCFGPACKRGHAQRVLPEGKEAQAEFWKKWNAEGHRVGQKPCDRDATQLRAQLEPWGTAVLRTKLSQDFGHVEAEIVTWSRQEVTDKLMEEYNKWIGSRQQQQEERREAAGGGEGELSVGDPPQAEEFHSGRKVIRVQGAPVRDDLIEEIRTSMKEWSANYQLNDRPTINASSYIILRSPAEFAQKDSQNAVKAATKLKQNQKVWDLAHKALAEVDPVFAEKFTALAMTCNFQGSPHIDNQNTGPFYGLSLGTFPDGQAGVMVEVDTFTIAHVNTRNRLGRVDGRYPHWVAPYDNSQYERYSLIFYQTEGKYAPLGPSYFPPTSATTEEKRAGEEK